MSTLNEREKHVIFWIEECGATQERVAEALGVSRSRVSEIYRRAKDKLRRSQLHGHAWESHMSPKTVRALTRAGIEDDKALHGACRSGRLPTIRGIGPKALEEIKRYLTHPNG